MSKERPHMTARPDGSCEDCGSFHGTRADELPELLNVENWRAMWPTWPETPQTAMMAHEQEVAAVARRVLGVAALVAEQIMRCFSEWHRMQPPPPIMVTREQAGAMGLKISPPATGG